MREEFLQCAVVYILTKIVRKMCIISLYYYFDIKFIIVPLLEHYSHVKM